MAEFNSHIVTNAGRNLLSRALSGEGKIIFTKAAFGNKQHTGNLKEITNLKNKKIDLNVINIRNDSGTAVLTVQISNKDVQESFQTEEFGVYAKIEGDSSEILYSYATAIAADTFPNNRLGQTYESIQEVYMTISSDTEAEIYVRDGVIYLTRDIANQVYTETGLIAVGELKGRSRLEANKQYQADNGHWYKNIGGDREWNSSGTPDNKLIPITWEELLKQLNEKTEDATKIKAGVVKFGETVGTALEGDKYPIIENKIKGVTGKNNGKFPLTSAIKGNVYLLEATQKYYICTQNYSGTQISVPNSNFEELSVFSNREKLENLYKPDFIKVTKTTGILIGSKKLSTGNFINVSSHFKRVYYAFFTSWASYESYGASIVSYLNTDNDMNVIYWVRKFQGGEWHNIFSTTKDSVNSYASCCYMIYGELK